MLHGDIKSFLKKNSFQVIVSKKGVGLKIRGVDSLCEDPSLVSHSVIIEWDFP